MKLTRHQSHSLTAELRQLGLSTWNFPTQLMSDIPKVHSRVVQTTSMYQIGRDYLLYIDENGAFLNQRLLSPFECTFIEDLPYMRLKVLGSVNIHIPLKALTAFLISADIIRTYVDVESTMVLHQVHSKMVKVHGYYVHYAPHRIVTPFGFSVTRDRFEHVCICRHSVKSLVSSNHLGKAC